MKTIAVAGKGGTGKTTLSALMVLMLKEGGATPILAVDADPNYNLGEALGIEVTETLGSATDEVLDNKGNIPPGMTKGALLEMRMHQSVIEGEKVDLLVMGRPEGPGCYCFANNLLRKALEELNKNYKMVLIDNEAGMEHLSRKTTAKVDILFLVSDHTIKGIRTAARLRDLAQDMKIDVKEVGLVVNMVEGEIDPRAVKEIESLGLSLAGVVPKDPAVSGLYLDDEPIIGIGDDSPVKSAVKSIMEKTGYIKNV
jgi:CO dehydrogenase maturation factor